MIELQRIMCVSGVFSILFLLSEQLYRSLDIKSEYSRKLVHVCTGMISLSFPFIFDDFMDVVLLCGGFMVVLAVVEKLSLLPSITNIDRKSSGSIYFPLSVIICFGMYDLSHDLVLFVLPVLILAISDPLAAVIGKRYGKRSFSIGGNYKTYVGTAAFFVSALMIVIGCNMVFEADFTVAKLVSVAAAACIAEATSRNGADNLFIPISVLVVFFFI